MYLQKNKIYIPYQLKINTESYLSEIIVGIGLRKSEKLK